MAKLEEEEGEERRKKKEEGKNRKTRIGIMM
jgi:hypothetical protein